MKDRSLGPRGLGAGHTRPLLPCHHVSPTRPGKGRGRQVIAVARTADVVIMMLDATKGEVQRSAGWCGGRADLGRALGGLVGRCDPELVMGGPGGAWVPPTWEQRQACPRAKRVQPPGASSCRGLRLARRHLETEGRAGLAEASATGPLSAQAVPALAPPAKAEGRQLLPRPTRSLAPSHRSFVHALTCWPGGTPGLPLPASGLGLLGSSWG